jgi:AcrR family transcriptional regulator
MPVDLNIEPAFIDGRRARSQESRRRIIVAMLELVREGDLTPNAENVAARAKVGLRSVFRHFKDMDSLYGEMSSVIAVEFMAVAAAPFVGTTWRERLDELVERRSGIFERMGPYLHAANLHRLTSPTLATDHRRLLTASRAILLGHLSPEIAADKATLEVLDMLLGFEAWSRLRQDQGLSPDETRAAVRLAIHRLVDIGA